MPHSFRSHPGRPRCLLFLLGVLAPVQVIGISVATASPREAVDHPAAAVLPVADILPAPPSPPSTVAPAGPGDPVPPPLPASAPPSPQPPPPPPLPPAEPVAPPSPAPTTSQPEAPAPESATERVERAFGAGVPAAWRARIEVRFELIEGWTSWAYTDGRIQIGRGHAEGRFDHLVDVIAHEFGHQIAFRYGTQQYAGAAPAGWPAPARHPAEAWADCVQSAFTGRANPSHGLPPCGGAQLDWARDWLLTGP